MPRLGGPRGTGLLAGQEFSPRSTGLLLMISQHSPIDPDSEIAGISLEGMYENHEPVVRQNSLDERAKQSAS
jgi:hypothetical protein